MKNWFKLSTASLLHNSAVPSADEDLNVSDDLLHVKVKY